MSMGNGVVHRCGRMDKRRSARADGGITGRARGAPAEGRAPRRHERSRRSLARTRGAMRCQEGWLRRRAPGRMVPLVDPDDLRGAVARGGVSRCATVGECSFEGRMGGGSGSLCLATSLASRLRGLLFRRPQAGVMLLAPCRDVHTFGMGHAVDVAFVDATGLVVEAHRAVAPGRRLRCRRARAVLERFAGEGPWLSAGDKVEMAVMGTALR